MSGDAFFDTNILLYMYDRRDARKHRKANEVFRSHFERRAIVLSTQVVQEFYAAAVKKLKAPPEEARKWAGELLEMKLVVLGRPHILRAFDLESRYRFSFWDSLILAASEAAGARTLFSEDFSPGQRIGEVDIVNPFVGC